MKIQLGPLQSDHGDRILSCDCNLGAWIIKMKSVFGNNSKQRLRYCLVMHKIESCIDDPETHLYIMIDK